MSEQANLHLLQYFDPIAINCRRVRALEAPDPDKPGHAKAVLGQRVILGLVGQARPRLRQQQEAGRCSDCAEVGAFCSVHIYIQCPYRLTEKLHILLVF